MTDKHVEAVARALLANDPRYDGMSFDYLSDTARRMFMSDARAALAALPDHARLIAENDALRAERDEALIEIQVLQKAIAVTSLSDADWELF